MVANKHNLDKDSNENSNHRSSKMDKTTDHGLGPEKVVSEASSVTTVAIVPGSKEDPYRTHRIGKQTLLVVCWIGIGFYNEIIGPTLPDLKDRLGVNYEVISRALGAKSIGSLIGALIGGFTHERFYRHSELIIACGLWLGAASTVCIPWGKYLEVVAMLFFFSGMSEGLINAGGNTIVMDLWKERAAAPMSSIHFGFGLGALLAPQIALPFLSPDAREQSDSLTTPEPTTLGWNSTVLPPGESRIEYAYAIVSGIVFVFGFIVLIVYLKGPPDGFVLRQTTSDWKVMVKPSTCGFGYTFYSVELLILLFWHFIHTVGGERAMSKYLFSFAQEADVQFTNQDASSLQTAFWGSFTAGRLLGVPISRYVPIWVIMLVDAIGGTVVAIVMSLYAYKNRTVLWVTSCFMGLFISVAFPNGMSWANLHLRMNNVSVMLLIMGGSVGGFSYQYLIGYLFERDPHNLPYVLIGYGGCLLIGFLIMQPLAVIHGRRIRKELKEKHDDMVIAISDKIGPCDSNSEEHDNGHKYAEYINYVVESTDF